MKVEITDYEPDSDIFHILLRQTPFGDEYRIYITVNADDRSIADAGDEIDGADNYGDAAHTDAQWAYVIANKEAIIDACTDFIDGL